MESTTKLEKSSKRDVAYYSQRFRNRVFAKLNSWIAAELERREISKKELAECMGKDPAQLTRILNHPSNLTLDTISELLLPFGAEAEPPDIILFEERPVANYIHPLIAKAAKIKPATTGSVASTSSGTTTVSSSVSSEVRILVTQSVG